MKIQCVNFDFHGGIACPPGSPTFTRTRPVRRLCMKPSFCWRSLAIGQIALVSSSRTAFPVLDVVGDEIQLLRREPVARRQHPVDLVKNGLGQLWPKLLARKRPPTPLTRPLPATIHEPRAGFKRNCENVKVGSDRLNSRFKTRPRSCFSDPIVRSR